MALNTSLPAWLKDFRAIAVALISEDGRIVEANEGFLMTLTGISEGFSTANFIEPSFNVLRYGPIQDNGLIYQGLLTLGAAEGAQHTFSGRVYRMDQMLFIRQKWTSPHLRKYRKKMTK